LKIGKKQIDADAISVCKGFESQQTAKATKGEAYVEHSGTQHGYLAHR
jgi:hypothetical protein